MEKIIKVGFLVSYDYEYLKIALPRVYPYMQEIVLCIDKDRKTWNGVTFEVEDDFWVWLKKFDIDNKIVLYQDSFYISDLSAMECETRERRMLAEKMGRCDWYIQLDSDEYFLDFPAFLSRLTSFDSDVPVTVSLRLIPMFKQTEEGVLLIDSLNDMLPCATNNPNYAFGRITSENTTVYWDELVLHQSWAREESEIRMKLSNWGHRTDFNTTSFYNLWWATDGWNYKYLRDFHPLDGPCWPALKLFLCKDVMDLFDARNELETTYLRDQLITESQEAKTHKKRYSLKFWK